MLPGCPAQPFRQHYRRLHHRPFIGTMVQKYNRNSLSFNDLHFVYFGEIVNERSEMDMASISFICCVKYLHRSANTGLFRSWSITG